MIGAAVDLHEECECDTFGFVIARSKDNVPNWGGVRNIFDSDMSPEKLLEYLQAFGMYIRIG
jgi:hypothetical protein